MTHVCNCHCCAFEGRCEPALTFQAWLDRSRAICNRNPADEAALWAIVAHGCRAPVKARREEPRD